MCGPGGRGQEAARQFVFALCPAFEQRNFIRDAKLDGLVVAGLEMQGRVIFQPVLPETIQCGQVEN